MDVVVLIGRILFALIFINSGIFGHLASLEGSSQYAAAKGIPSAKPMVALTGIQILVGGLMVLLGVWIDLGALLVLIFALLAAFLMHAFWKVEDPMQKQGEMVNFMKNISMAGGALIIFGLADSIPLTLTDPLF